MSSHFFLIRSNSIYNGCKEDTLEGSTVCGLMSPVPLKFVLLIYKLFL